jgi:predicted MPP superfamily phosphohydrolase
LAGLNDLWNGPEPAETLSGCSAEDTILLMSHSPDAILFDASRAADLLVAAHTHGGQIRLPFLGPAAFVPTVLSKKYSQGLFNLAGTETFITSGLGETGPRARFFNPPEIAVLELN